MAWFLNYYECDECGNEWAEEWSCMCDATCGCCGRRAIEPSDSDELTFVIECRSRKFAVLRSPDSAEDSPDYTLEGLFSTRGEAQRHILMRESDGSALNSAFRIWKLLRQSLVQFKRGFSALSLR